MYVVRTKKTKEVLFVNPAPLKDELKGTAVWPEYDHRKMEILRSNLPDLPADYRVNEDGLLVALTNEERLAEGILKLAPDQKLHKGEIVSKTTAEKAADGLILLDEPFEYVDKNDQINHRSIADVISGKHLKTVAHCERVTAAINQQIESEISEIYPTGKEISLIKNYLYWMADGQPAKDDREKLFFDMRQFTDKIKAKYALLREAVNVQKAALSKPAAKAPAKKAPEKKAAAKPVAKTPAKKAPGKKAETASGKAAASTQKPTASKAKKTATTSKDKK